MNRRAFLRTACTLATLAAVLPARAAPGGGGGAEVPKPRLPFETVGPFDADSSNVFGFFHFTCPFCRQHFPSIENWGSTLPQPLRFAASPIPNDPAGLEGARAFYAVARAAPAKLVEFEQVVYGAVHDQRLPADEARTYREAAAQVGVPMAALDQWWRHVEVRRDVLRAKLRYERYAIENTPSIAIGGRYVLYADLTNGDYATLLNLANGIVSQMLPQFSSRSR